MRLNIPVQIPTLATAIVLYIDIAMPSHLKPFFHSTWSSTSANRAMNTYEHGRPPMFFINWPISTITMFVGASQHIAEPTA